MSCSRSQPTAKVATDELRETALTQLHAARGLGQEQEGRRIMDGAAQGHNPFPARTMTACRHAAYSVTFVKLCWRQPAPRRFTTEFSEASEHTELDSCHTSLHPGTASFFFNFTVPV